MNRIVAKFGGSSLADASQIRKVVRILREDPSRRYVVVSAPGKRGVGDVKVTDLLYRCCDAAISGADYASPLEQIRQRFDDIIRDLGIEFDLDSEIEAIRAHLQAHPQRDFMASRGEYLNAKIIAVYLGFPFLDAAALVRFSPDGKFEDAQTDANLRAALALHPNAVLPGFYGADETGRVHTFSRGGSDVTGALVARAVNADLYENWTDVSGMLFTDPRIVDNPKTIASITYRELRELSYMGASVLHEDAVFPVRKAGIPIQIRNTNRPQDAGTMILSELPEAAPKQSVTGVAGRRGFTSILVEKSMMNSEVGFGAELLEIFAAHGVPFEHCPTGIDTMTVIVGSAQFRVHKDSILQQIRRRLQPEFMSVESGLAMIAVVGYGMIYAKGSAARIFTALADNGINIRMIDQGSSEMNIIIGVDEADFENAIRSIYRVCVQ